MKYVLAAALVVELACSGDAGKRGAPPPAPATALSADAGTEPTDAGITRLPSYDPSSGYALDPDPQPRTPTRPAARDHRTVELLLRSTPVGAIAAVDGVRLGPTPLVWNGEAGVSHEFTFVMPGHALARYRFVPITGGVVHGRLTRVDDDQPMPVAPPPPSPAEPARPVRPPPPPPPPVDAAVPPPPPVVDAAPPPLPPPPVPPIDAAPPTEVGGP